jgi:polyisoprenoid-binding protein YceI
MIPATHSPSRPRIQSVSSLVAIRALILSTALAVIAVLSPPQALAAAAPTTTALTITSSGSDVTSVAAGTVITLTVTVASGSTPVSPGQVKFCVSTAKYCEDSALLATVQLTSAGTATYKFQPGIGSHSYQAIFVGTSSYAKSTSATAALTVTGTYPTTTTLAPSGTPGDYTLTATVVGTGSRTLPPTGDVSFLDTTNGNASLGTGALGTATLENSFAGSSPDIGFGSSVAVGDFNGDGVLDAAVVSFNPNDVSVGELKVSLGNGDGTFTSKAQASIPASSPDFVVAGDFNGDGILDLAVANNTNPSSLTVLLGNGDGTFTLKSSPSVGNNPVSIAIGDFNGDGILDLAVANSSDNTVTVLLGNGDGTFTLKSSPAVGNGPDSVALGDFNGDGILDLAVANFSDSTVTVLLGKGDGTFTTKSTPAVGPSPTSVVVADFNGDGKPDLAVANCAISCAGNGGYTYGEVTILLGNGNGTFTTKSSPHAGYYSNTAVVSDFNEDGIPDLAVLGYGLVTVLLGNGDGTFTNEPNIGAGGSFLAVGDFNGDGAPDLLLPEGAYDTATLLLDQFTETATATLSKFSLSGTETHVVEASYPGDTNYNSSTSSTVPLLAAQIATTLNLSSSANPSPPGSLVTLTAILSPYFLGTFTTNGETVTFYNGGTSIGTGTLSSGVATLYIYSLPLGTDTLTANYPGDGNFTPVTSKAIAQVVETRVATPVFSLVAGFYYTTQTVKITDTTPGAIIYYTTDGTTPTTSSTVYAVPVIVSNSETLQAIAIAPNYFQSDLATAAYSIAAAIPVLSPPSGTYTTPQMVSITSAAPGATIYYTTDGTVPGYASPIFNPMNPILVNATETIKAYAVASGYALSPQGVANYNIIPPYAPTPTFSLAAGFYKSSVMVSIMDSLAGATIHYTTDHTTPTASSPVYGGTPITINSTERLQAIAVAPNYSPSAVALSDYYIATAEPVLSLPTGTYKGAQTVTITDSTPGAIIYYTTNGTVPNRASPTISPGGSITVSASETLKAIGVAAGYLASPQAAAWYTITP